MKAQTHQELLEECAQLIHSRELVIQENIDLIGRVSRLKEENEAFKHRNQKLVETNAMLKCEMQKIDQKYIGAVKDFEDLKNLYCRSQSS